MIAGLLFVVRLGFPEHVEAALDAHAEIVARSTGLPAADARLHVAAATFAAGVTGMDAQVVLAIAYHETGMGRVLVGSEAVGGVSCGVMMVGQFPRCPPPLLTLVGGYLAGAWALRRWLEEPACRGDMTCALWGYAGGWRAIRVCRSRWHRDCRIPSEFRAVAEAMASGVSASRALAAERARAPRRVVDVDLTFAGGTI